VTSIDFEPILHQENLLVLIMLDSSNTSHLSQASSESADDFSLLSDLSFSYDLGISVATTLVEGILLQFPHHTGFT
jgi:hypothetical protein